MSEVSTMHPTVQMRDVWTIGDLDELEVQDWWRYQILDGSLVVSPAAGGKHELSSADLRAALCERCPDGSVVVGPIGVDLGPSYFIPDLVVARRDDIRASSLLVPDQVQLCVEVVSPGSTTMDRVLKPAKYAAAGVQRYWRLETDPVSLTAYRLAGDTYAEVGSWSSGLVEVDDPYPVTIDIDAIG